MQYIFIGNDKENHLETRLQNREEHIKHLKSANDFDVKILIAGPVLNDNEEMSGSVVVFECENMDIAQKYWEQDPYAKAELFENVTIKPYKIALNNF